MFIFQEQIWGYCFKHCINTYEDTQVRTRLPRKPHSCIVRLPTWCTSFTSTVASMTNVQKFWFSQQQFKGLLWDGVLPIYSCFPFKLEAPTQSWRPGPQVISTTRLVLSCGDSLPPEDLTWKLNDLIPRLLKSIESLPLTSTNCKGKWLSSL